MTVHGTFTTLVPRYLYRTKSSFVRCRRSKVNTARLHEPRTFSTKFPINPDKRFALVDNSFPTMEPIRPSKFSPRAPRAFQSRNTATGHESRVILSPKVLSETRMYGEEKKVGITRDRKVQAYSVPPWISWQDNHSSLFLFFPPHRGKCPSHARSIATQRHTELFNLSFIRRNETKYDRTRASF